MSSPITDALMANYARADLAFTHGEGAYLYTADGRRYLDFMAGIAVNSLGHCHPHLVKALTDQAAKLWHTSNVFRIPEGERLADRLTANTFADKVFYCNSGVEAFEAANKMVRKYHSDKGTGRWKTIACTGAFHGRSLTAIAAGGNPKHLEGFAPDVPGFEHVPFNNMNELRAAITDETAAILVEPVQGEGGVTPAKLQFLADLRAVCDEFGLLLVFDEVQCGVGRTGKFFAHEWSGITPDIMMVAKGLGGGFPIGAVLASEAAAAGFTPGTHGTTFGGNPLAMAVGNAVLDIVLGEGFLAQVQQTGELLWQELDALVGRHPAVLETVRGAGLMQGLKAKVPNGEIIGALREEGMLTVGASDNVVRLLPPLIIDESHIKEAVGCLDKVCGAMAKAA